jgi:MFS family permease
MASGDRAIWQELRASGALGRFGVLCLGVWLHAADSLVTATVLPAIVHDIGGIAYVSWTIAFYQVGAVVAGAAAAMLSQRIGLRGVLLVGALVYGLGCVMGALTPNMALLLVARFVQGIGGGMLVSISYVAIEQSFPKAVWGRLFGIEAVIWGAGSLIGPLLGGLFAHFEAWRWVFWFFAIQAGLLCVLALARLPAQRLRGSVEPWPVLPLLGIAVATLLIAEAGIVRETAISLIEGVAGVGLLYAALRLDQSAHSARLLPAGALSFDRPLGAGFVAVFALAVATTGFWAYGPLILKVMFGIEPLVAGCILALESIAWSATTMALGGMAPERDRWLIRIGALLVTAGSAGFAIAVPTGSLAGMVVCALLQGLGFGASWPWIVRRAVGFAAEGEGGLAAAAPGVVQRIGYGVGAAATGIAANAAGLADGITVPAARAAGFWVFAGLLPVLVVALVAAWRFTAHSSD